MRDKFIIHFKNAVLEIYIAPIWLVVGIGMLVMTIVSIITTIVGR